MRFDKDGFNLGSVGSREQLVVVEGRIEHPALGVEHVLFRERSTDGIENGAFGLALCKFGVDRDTAVHRGHVTRHANLPSLGVHFDFAEVGRERRRRHVRDRGGMSHKLLLILGVQCTACDRLKGNLLPGTSLDVEALFAKREFVGLSTERLGSHSTHFLEQVLGGSPCSLTTQVGSAGGIGSRVEGRVVCVRHCQDDIAHRDMERLGNDLGKDGICPSPQICRAAIKIHGAVIIELHDRRGHINFRNRRALHENYHASATLDGAGEIAAFSSAFFPAKRLRSATNAFGKTT